MPTSAIDDTRTLLDHEFICVPNIISSVKVFKKIGLIDHYY